MQSRLKQILQPVFQLMKIDASGLEESPDYVMTLEGGLKVELRESPPDFLTVSCLLPISAERFDDPQTLAILLQTNLLGLDHPPILTGAIVEQKKIIVWTRQPFLMLDAHGMKRLFERYVEQAQKTAGWLARPQEPTNPSGPRAGAGLPRGAKRPSPRL